MFGVVLSLWVHMLYGGGGGHLLGRGWREPHTILGLMGEYMCDEGANIHVAF